MRYQELSLLCAALLPSFVLAVPEYPKTFEMYAYRTDKKAVATQFFKLCVRKEGTYRDVQLFAGDPTIPNFKCPRDYVSAGAQIEQRSTLNYVPTDSIAVQMVEAQLKKEGWDYSRPNRLQFSKDFYEKEKESEITTLTHFVAYDGGATALSIKTPTKLKTRGKYDDIVDQISWEHDWAKLQLSTTEQLRNPRDANFKSSPDQYRRLNFDSNVDHGPLFEDPKVLPRKVDLDLDSVSMVDKEGKRLKLSACDMSKGFGSLKSYEVYLHNTSAAPFSKSARCFPIQLTIAPNLVHHAMHLYLEKARVVQFFDYDEYDNSPGYKETPFEVLPDTPKKGEAVVVAKNDKGKVLLRFNKDHKILEDNTELYIPKRNREELPFSRKVIENQPQDKAEGSMSTFPESDFKFDELSEGSVSKFNQFDNRKNQ